MSSDCGALVVCARIAALIRSTSAAADASALCSADLLPPKIRLSAPVVGHAIGKGEHVPSASQISPTSRNVWYDADHGPVAEPGSGCPPPGDDGRLVPC